MHTPPTLNIASSIYLFLLLVGMPVCTLIKYLYRQAAAPGQDFVWTLQSSDWLISYLTPVANHLKHPIIEHISLYSCSVKRVYICLIPPLHLNIFIQTTSTGKPDRSPILPLWNIICITRPNLCFTLAIIVPPVRYGPSHTQFHSSSMLIRLLSGTSHRSS